MSEVREEDEDRTTLIPVTSCDLFLMAAHIDNKIIAEPGFCLRAPGNGATFDGRGHAVDLAHSLPLQFVPVGPSRCAALFDSS